MVCKCRGAAGPASHNYWAFALEPVLRNKRGRDSERPAYRDEERPQALAQKRRPNTAKNKYKNKF